MADFQWNESDIEWFVNSFKDEPKEINARMIHDKCKGKYKRLKRSDKPSFQDLRDLMRYVVRHKSARVTESHVTSKKYRIKMVSEKYPYEQNFFDPEFFNHTLFCEISDLRKLLKSFPFLLGNGASLRLDWYEALQLEKMYVQAFLAHNDDGGDLDLVFEKFGWELNSSINENQKDFLNPKYIASQRDSFCKSINYFAVQYKLFKNAFDDLVMIPEISNVGRGIRNHNDLFILTFNRFMALDFIERIKLKRKGYESANRTRYNKVKNILENTGNPEALMYQKPEFDDGLRLLRKSVIFWLRLPEFVNNDKKEVLEIYQECKQAFFDIYYSLAEGMRDETQT
jgi:hypothetical protein